MILYSDRNKDAIWIIDVGWSDGNKYVNAVVMNVGRKGLGIQSRRDSFRGYHVIGCIRKPRTRIQTIV
jgi:hypothetical protein